MDQIDKALDMQAAKPSGLGQISTSGLGRDKAWAECGIEEKVERLRRELMDYRWGVQDARRRARQFEEHSHDALGKVVVPLRAKYAEGEAMGRDSLA